MGSSDSVPLPVKYRYHIPSDPSDLFTLCVPPTSQIPVSHTFWSKWSFQPVCSTSGRYLEYVLTMYFSVHSRMTVHLSIIWRYLKQSSGYTNTKTQDMSRMDFIQLVFVYHQYTHHRYNINYTVYVINIGNCTSTVFHCLVFFILHVSSFNDTRGPSVISRLSRVKFRPVLEHFTNCSRN